MIAEEFLEVPKLEPIARGEKLSELLPPDRAMRHAQFLLKLGDEVIRRDLEKVFFGFDIRKVHPILRSRAYIQIPATEYAFKVHEEVRGAVPSPAEKKKIEVKQAHHALEIAGLVVAAGTNDLSEPIHVHDVCAGVGRAGYGVALARRDRETSVTAWEQRADLVSTFSRWMGTLPKATAEFRVSAVGDADLSERDGKPTFCIGKHSCGSATTDILEQLQKLPGDQRPKRTVIMPCCRGNAKNNLPMDSFVDSKDWFYLSRMAGSSDCSDPVVHVLNLVARRLFDACQIASLTGEFRVRVEELYYPFEKLYENHGIVLE